MIDNVKAITILTGHESVKLSRKILGHDNHSFPCAPHSATSDKKLRHRTGPQARAGMLENETKIASSEAGNSAYWVSAKRVTIGLLFVWFAVSFGAGFLCHDLLNTVSIGGAPRGFWLAQNGSIYGFLILIVIAFIRIPGTRRKAVSD